MDDLSFRAEFHRALDPIAPPAPWLAAAMRDGLRTRQAKARKRDRGTQPVHAPGWLLPGIAALLAIAIVIALVAGSHLLRLNRTVPVAPLRHGAAAPADCPGWTTNGGTLPYSDRMFSTSTGWVFGALKTTDGGATWHRTLPEDILAEAPKGTDRRAYPPGYTDYFLNANHAWLAYGVPSATSCFEHISVFLTSDGGRSWRRSHPIKAAIQADTDLQLLLDFVDSRHGWLLVLAGGRLAPDDFVYFTSDGGMSWQLMSQLQQLWSSCGVTFISANVGFLSGCGGTPYVFGTRDGGRTWQEIFVPAPAGHEFTVNAPIFFDDQRGVVHLSAQSLVGNTSVPIDAFAVTDDGGSTWRALPPPNFPGYAQGLGFADRTHFFALVSDSTGSSETVYVSADGGLTWSHAGGSFNGLYQAYPPQLLFLDAQHGFIDELAQQIGQAPFAFLATNDSGRTWTDMHPRLT